MTLYRRGSVTVEAMEVSRIIELTWVEPDLAALPDWARRAIEGGNMVVQGDIVEVLTTEGWQKSTKPDWIIQRLSDHGELYPIRAKTFTDPKAGYKPVP